MGKTLKSQWEFGELFPAEAVKKVLTVSEVTGSIRRVLEKEVGRVSVMGELTNLRMQSSGHVYFTIKDANAQLSCVMFRTEAQLTSRSVFQEGLKVVVDGEITVYETRGQYQLRALTMQPQGVGALQAAFERLKLKLKTEGLFEQGRKRALPRYPQRIGLVTSLEGAAIQDVLHAIQRRNPSLGLVLAACRVQGQGAGPEIAAALQALNEWARSSGQSLDAILLTRGGGSLEDLWAFNEEIVARAIYASDIPVVSAVGHEIDFTISDFVADLRAATPTAGAEILTEGIFAIRPFVAEAAQVLRELVQHEMEIKRDLLREQLRHLSRTHPKRQLQEHAQRIDGWQNSLKRCLKYRFAAKEARIEQARTRLARVQPKALLEKRRNALSTLISRLDRSAADGLKQRREHIVRAETRLGLLSPRRVLERGYSITLDESSGQAVRDAAEVSPGARLRSLLAKGEVSSIVPPAR